MQHQYPADHNWHTISEIADHYAVHPNTVRSWIAAGRLKAHKLDRIVRIAAHDLEAFETSELAPVGVPGHRLRRAPTNKRPSASTRLNRTRSKTGGQNG